MTVLRARVIGLGERAAGDDGVGLAVLDRLRADGLPEGTDVVAVRDPSELVGLLAGAETVILVDAVLGRRPGEVLELAPEDVAARAAISTHGIDVAQAIALARVLNDGARPAIRIVGIGVERPAGLGGALSPAVATAVAPAAARVRALLGT